MVPAPRVQAVNDAEIRPDRPIVLYWMIAARRTRSNFGLERAVAHARRLGKPLVVLEALRVDHTWASDRFHQFVLDGMRANAEALSGRSGVTYLAYLEPAPGQGRGLLEALAAHAAVIVTDDFPSFFLPRMVAAAGARLGVKLEAVDSNGLLPMRAFDRTFPSAHAFRRAWQQVLAVHLEARPERDPLSGMPTGPTWTVPAELRRRWPDAFTWLEEGHSIAGLPIDHRVRPASLPGGSGAARERLDAFIHDDLPLYGTERNDPDRDAGSRLSAYLHWGHISAHEVFDRVMAREGWLGQIPARPTGARAGWWGVSPAAESFLDQLVTWRELGYNMTSRQPHDYDRFESLPAWAVQTLERHEDDPREPLYDLETLERAATYDPLWNAAQRQLVSDGRIQNYLRMLWGKKILQWSASPRRALEVMVHLNNKYSLDGRNPNSYSGIFWILGRYDRPWGPERPIFGTVRYMTSENTARKLHVKQYLARHAAPDTPRLF
jgi:deoxyribodipyrimidine photo-lyase